MAIVPEYKQKGGVAGHCILADCRLPDKCCASLPQRVRLSIRHIEVSNYMARGTSQAQGHAVGGEDHVAQQEKHLTCVF